MKHGTVTYHLAIDIGASGGRVIVGWLEGGRLLTEEVHRFAHAPRRLDGQLCWEIEAILREIIVGLRHSCAIGKTPATLAIDTWGVDFVLLDANDREIGRAVSYRDERTARLGELEAIIPAATLYSHTGIQRQPFNTIYQLVALQREHPSQLEQAAALLMLPDYLAFRLTGQKRQEFTNATTTALVNAARRRWDSELIATLALPAHLFGPLSEPGAPLGNLLPSIRAAVGFDCQVLLAASHDTASAFMAAPLNADKESLILSSGTWSLLGIERQSPLISEVGRRYNFTNEGGYGGSYRLLKNIMGLWLLQSLRRELNSQNGTNLSFEELRAAAEAATHFSTIIDVNDNRFLAPTSMIEAIREYCRQSGETIPQSAGELARCVYLSLAEAYAETVAQLRALTAKEFSLLNVVGGGCRDSYLNQLIADRCRLPLMAGPVEASAIGNLIAQMIATNQFCNLRVAREAVNAACAGGDFLPKC